MNLETASGLLEGSSRYFSEIYKLYEFRDDASVKDYFDFILHEPVEWLRGFPSKLTQKGSLSRPKAAIIKLLKMPAVIEALGEQYTKQVYTVVWNTFKNHIDTIVASRNTVAQERQEKNETASSSSSPCEPVPPVRNEFIQQPQLHIEECIETNDIEELVVPVTSEWEHKYRILEKAYLELLNGNIAQSTETLVVALRGDTPRRKNTKTD